MSGMNATSLRLALRLHRFEAAAFAIVILGLAVAAFVVAGMLDATGYGRLCLDPTGTAHLDPTGPPHLPPTCEAIGARFFDLQNRLGGPIAGMLVVLSFVAAALIGVAVIAREIERGTTRLAWSLAPSRRRWYITRVLPLLVALIVVTFLAGIATDRLTAATEPGIDLANSFDGFGQRGGLIAARSVFIFAVAVLVGALVGRTLPALIVAALVAYIGLGGGEDVHSRIIRSEAIVVPESQVRPGDRWIDIQFQLPDGRLVGWDVVEQLDPPKPDVEWIPKYPQVAVIVPGTRYRFVEAREAGALLGGSIVALGLGGVVVARRRPD
jgi:hypothetical protein